MPATRPARSQVVVLRTLPGRVSPSWRQFDARQFDACPGLCAVGGGPTAAEGVDGVGAGDVIGAGFKDAVVVGVNTIPARLDGSE
jgi:hypothetical protein